MTDKVENPELDIDDEDVLDEAHDTKDAEKHSIGHVRKAGDVTKQAPARKGDKRNHDPMPVTKAGKIAVAHELMSEMTGEQLDNFISSMQDGEAVSESRVVEGQFSAADDLNALVESEATLSEEFKAKASVLFETAVKARLATELDRLEEAYSTELEEQVTSIREGLTEAVDNYLNYVVENWLEENKLAVEAGLRTEIAETFIDKLKDLFTESYIQVPETKVDLVDELASDNEELEEALNATVAKNLRLAEENQMLKRDKIITEATKDLADTQITKLTSLVETVTFDDEESFRAKVKIIKESHFNTKPATPGVESLNEETETQEIDPRMAAYVSAIRKNSH